MTPRPALIALMASVCACSVPAADARSSGPLPDRAAFPVVAQALVRRCGTLDCHGQASRNLRLYGSEGLRWAPTDRPQSPRCTTDDEFDQDYDSVVGLEPELLSAVVADGGADPERLTLVRKALGLEAHKGGAPFPVGGDGDHCLRSWLRDQTDTASCLATLSQTVANCFE